ncbi:MAG TPA: RNA polymerase-binding protein RbpA [Mycobacteriales bacterium]|nr:RNA polymerase-binding protein RbpA [Mycobacteriales bacterium]
MAGGNAIRGSRVGAGPMGEAERGDIAPQRRISFWCANRHEVRPSFAVDAAVPDTWDCPRCGYPAGRDEDNPPAPPKIEPYKTHLAYVRERRSDADGEAILAEALERLRARP